jgi:hypothetical protein
MSNSAIRLTTKAFNRYGVEYTIYEENNRFKGTPIPKGYRAIYVPAQDFIPDSLKLEKIEGK